MKTHSSKFILLAFALATISGSTAYAKDKDKDKDDDKHYHSKKTDHSKHDRSPGPAVAHPPAGKPRPAPDLASKQKPTPPTKTKKPAAPERKITNRPDLRRELRDPEDFRRPPSVVEIRPAVTLGIDPRVVIPGSATVANVQRALATRGFYFGAIDGLNGPATRRAIAACQQEYGLAVTATITPSLMRALQL